MFQGMTSPSIQDHLSPTNTNYQNGIYLVVGTSEEDVTLLRVSDADGHRINTGEIITVSYTTLDEFVPAENLDGNRPLEDTVISLLEVADIVDQILPPCVVTVSSDSHGCHFVHWTLKAVLFG